MAGPHAEYAEVYRQHPIPTLLLTLEFIVADANQAYLEVTGRTREQLLGHDVFEAFPDNPADPHTTSVRDSSVSLAKVLTTGKPDVLSFQKYDLKVPGSPGVYAARYWNVVNAPVLGPDGQLMLITHCTEEITERVNRFLEGLHEGN